MRVFIAGLDGYLGWPLAQYLINRGHIVGGIDNFSRRSWVAEVGGDSAIPISPIAERFRAVQERYGLLPEFREGDLREYECVKHALAEFKPDAVVHLGECPSAAYSMMDVEHATYVQVNNIVSTLNLLYAIQTISRDIHLIKLGTMGEYGTPNVNIPEGFFEIDYRGRRDRLPFPRQAGSWYHWSKVHGSNNVMFAVRLWGLCATDIMQGVVFGTRIDEMGNDKRLATRLDFDQAFGTVINRYCCQAVIGHPLTPFGAGLQKRGFITLRDSMQCLTLALEKPSRPGEYRVLNQFAEVYDVTDLARKVQVVAREFGIDAKIAHLENPRKESEEHYYEPDHITLFELGFRPSSSIDDELCIMLGDLMPHRERIKERASLLIPDIRWDGERAPVRYLNRSRSPSSHDVGQ